MNLGALRSHFKSLLNRSDITDALANTFIDQGISRIQRSLRIPTMEKQAQYPISASTSKLTVPNDFLEIIDFYYDNMMLTRMPMNRMQRLKDDVRTGSPLYFSREGGDFLLHPIPTSGTVYINYYAQFPTMSLDSDENTLAKIGSDLIIYSALTYASDYYLDERAGLFAEKYQAFMYEIQLQADEAETSGTIQSIRPAYQYHVE